MVIIGRKIGLDYNSWYACLTWSGTLDDLLDPNGLQTLIAGRKRRERERARERENIETQCLGKSINLVTTASDEDPKPKLIVRIGFCIAKSDIPSY